MNDFLKLTDEELTVVDGGHGSWNSLGEIISGAGGGAIGGAWAGPPGALVGAVVAAKTGNIKDMFKTAWTSAMLAGGIGAVIPEP